jgi:U3 small nucleolar RNA-associated protein MPP10
VDPRDEKLKKEHMEIEKMWKEIAAKLDSLCNWHYRPRPVEMSVQVRSDAPTVTMEDARPSGVGGVDVGEASQLAPQEVYRVGEGKERDEVLTGGGAVVKREELTREQKLRRRRREKERAKKAASNVKPASEAKKDKRAREKKDVVSSLKKGSVTVIGRTGELLNVEGNAAKGKKSTITGGHLKL